MAFDKHKNKFASRDLGVMFDRDIQQRAVASTGRLPTSSIDKHIKKIGTSTNDWDYETHVGRQRVLKDILDHHRTLEPSSIKLMNRLHKKLRNHHSYLDGLQRTINSHPQAAEIKA